MSNFQKKKKKKREELLRLGGKKQLSKTKLEIILKW